MMKPRFGESKRRARPAPQLTEERIEDVLDAVEHNKSVRRAMPEWGRIHVDRQLPFLCIYRKPEDYSDFGTDRLIVSQHPANGGELDTLFVGKIAPKHTAVAEELLLRNILIPPPLRPRYYKSKEARDRLEKIRKGGTVLDLLKQ